MPRRLGSGAAGEAAGCPTRSRRPRCASCGCLNQARTLNDLRAPPGNRLKGLKGHRQGQYSIRINQQWRICFRWQEGAAHVEIVDDHD
jgi:plasmid maintenance system killer protein